MEMESFALLTPRCDIVTGRSYFLLCGENSFDTIKHNFKTSESPKARGHETF